MVGVSSGYGLNPGCSVRAALFSQPRYIRLPRQMWGKRQSNLHASILSLPAEDLWLEIKYRSFLSFARSSSACACTTHYQLNLWQNHLDCHSSFFFQKKKFLVCISMPKGCNCNFHMRTALKQTTKGKGCNCNCGSCSSFMAAALHSNSRNSWMSGTEVDGLLFSRMNEALWGLRWGLCVINNELTKCQAYSFGSINLKRSFHRGNLQDVTAPCWLRTNRSAPECHLILLMMAIIDNRIFMISSINKSW